MRSRWLALTIIPIIMGCEKKEISSDSLLVLSIVINDSNIRSFDCEFKAKSQSDFTNYYYEHFANVNFGDTVKVPFDVPMRDNDSSKVNVLMSIRFHSKVYSTLHDSMNYISPGQPYLRGWTFIRSFRTETISIPPTKKLQSVTYNFLSDTLKLKEFF